MLPFGSFQTLSKQNRRPKIHVNIKTLEKRLGKMPHGINITE